MAIPVRNLYYLICYAWDHLEALDLVDAGVLDADRPEDLFAHLLREGVSRALRRGLDRQYLTESDELPLIRGKLDVSSTVKRLLHETGRARCEYDELSHDVLHNRILKATLRRLARSRDVGPEIQEDLHDLVARLGKVSDTPVSDLDFRRVQLHRNNAHYSFLLQLCELVQRSWLPDQALGGYRFHDFRGSDQEMGALFEAFVRNFLAREQDVYRVGSEHVPWKAESAGGASLKWLPQMRTDVSLWGPGRRVIIETKFYRNPLQERFGAESVRSAHLYQLFSYLKNLGVEEPAPIGVLLYAETGSPLRFDAVIQGHPLLVRSLDLDEPWQDVRRSLERIVEEIASYGSVGGTKRGDGGRNIEDRESRREGHPR